MTDIQEYAGLLPQDIAEDFKNGTSITLDKLECVLVVKAIACLLGLMETICESPEEEMKVTRIIADGVFFRMKRERLKGCGKVLEEKKK